MDWAVEPEPADRQEHAALLAAVEKALAPERESLWWRLGLEDLRGGPSAEQAWGDSGVVEP
jgi:hypothetical protein